MSKEKVCVNLTFLLKYTEKRGKFVLFEHYRLDSFFGVNICKKGGIPTVCVLVSVVGGRVRFRVCHQWMWKTWKLAYFMVRLRDRRSPEWQCIYFNVTDKSLGKSRRAATSKQAQVLDESDTFPVPMQKCCCRTLCCLGLEQHQINAPLIPPDEASPEPVLLSTVGIMNLLVAARRALLRSLSACLWDPPAEEKCGRAGRRLRQDSAADTSSHWDAVCPIRRRQASVCGSFRERA